MHKFQFALKLIALLLILGFVLFKLYEAKADLGDLKQTLSEAFHKENTFYWCLIFLLLPVNWMLEAFKWQLAARLVEPIAYHQALRGVLSGLALGFITPHAWGDYAGRIWHLKQEGRQYALGPVLMTRAAQMLVTLVAGLPGLFFLMQSGTSGFSLPPALVNSFAIGMSVVLLLLYLWVGRWSAASQSILGKYGWYAYVRPLQGFSAKLSGRLLVLSALRYVVFAGQFMLLLVVFEVDLPLYMLALGVGFVYLAKSVIPAFNFLSDLGVREFSALLFFSTLDVSAALIVLASLALWLINILLPTLVGGLLIFKARILLPK
jgi:hypothetical protein